MKLNLTTVERRAAFARRRGIRRANETRDESQKRVPLSTLDARPSTRSAVALIITLILLAVVTFMALTFLAISRRERNAVTATTDSITAQLAADGALASAEAQVVASILATSNSYNFGLLVSTNYINSLGFQTGVANPTNVNYYYPNGNPITGPDFLQNLANLYYLPRVPVYMSNFVAGTMENRFFLDLNRNGQDDPNGLVPEIGPNGNYMLNNGVVVSNYQVGDPEWIGVLQHPDQPYGPNNPFVARYAFIALPIGNALDLNAIHNQVLDEYGDLGTANQKGVTVNPPPFGPIPGGTGDGFMRNQGVGSWEINLAAFLADLNTNEWGLAVGSGTNLQPGAVTYYQYNRANPFPSGPQPNQGHAFDDARALLTYRYKNNYLSLKIARFLFPFNGTGFQFDNIDGYSDGPLQTTRQPINEVGLASIQDDPAFAWSGADNTNRYIDAQELFDTNKTALGVTAAQLFLKNDFPDRLTNANSSVSTYNRYTYYRMLSQMGVDSAPEQNKLNLNYRNETNGVILPNLETNFIPWTALEFFTNAADRMLRTYSRQWLAESPSNFLATYGSFANFGTLANPTNVPVSFGISDIPVYVNSNFVYTPAVQRVLQLAANIYDATTNNTLAQGANYPSVFRPTFLVADDPVSGSRNVYINGYKQVVSVPLGGSDPQLALPVNVTDLTAPPFGLGVWTNVNVYGVPWVIGTKKGFPNFNEFSLQSLVGITRRLQVTRPATNAPPPASVDFSRFHTNEMYTMCVSNWVGVEFWNSYTNNYVPVSGLSIWVRGNLSMTLTNDDGMAPVYLNPLNPPTHYLPLDNSVLIASPQYWPGVLPWDGDGHATNASFDIPLYTNVVMQLNPAYVATSNWWTYSFNSHQFVPVPNTPIYETVSGFPFPHFGLVTTNRLQVFMLDGTHVVDYAQFAGPDNLRDLNAEIFNDQNASSDVWITNSSGASATFGVPDGILNQLRISRGSLSSPNFSDDGIWHADPEAVPYGGTKEQQQAYFDGFFRAGNIGRAGGETAENLQLTNQAPYSPTRYVVLYTTWQANDPLVHYTPGDLNFTWNTGGDLVPGTNRFNYGNSMPVLPNIGSLNDHYMPWGRSLLAPGADTNAYNLAVKDPLVWQSQDWDFPAYKFPTVGWLGRVHRGTPWQTVYLKSFDVLRETIVKGATISYVGTNTWSQWTGDTQLANGQNYDAANSAPVQDRLLFDVFTTALNDNATRGQLSVNVAAGETNNPLAGLAAWSAVFSGVIPLADTPVTPFFNPLTEQGVQHANLVTNYTALSPINPAGRAGASSILGGIVTNINLTRTAFTNADGLAGSFEHVGDILTAPQLTVQSPFLNWANVAQQANGISDELYEWLPQQLMSLLRVDDTPRYVIYSYGQALKPAPNGIYTGGGAYFGMVTNYQVVAEAATRAVVRFNGIRTNIITTVVTFDSSGNKITNLVNLPVVTNNTAVVEQFNTLPSN